MINERAPRKTFVIDLDGTICSQKSFGSYHEAEPNSNLIRKINGLYLDGHKIIIYTARGMNHYFGVDDIERNMREETAQWLARYNVCYDRLVFGKPSGDHYIDDKGMSISEFTSQDFS